MIAMNKLPNEKRIQILSLLCEGASMRSISRVCDVSINTVTKLLIDAGNACATFHFDKVRDLTVQRVQCDEIWSFCYKKQANATTQESRMGRGDVWTWTAIDADSKLIISWLVGERDAEAASLFIDDLRGRIATRVQLTTDGFRPYLQAIEGAFGADVDYAMLVKLYGDDKPAKGATAARRYSPSGLVGTRNQTIMGSPDERYVSTSYAERHNLTMRMSMRRFTRLTNAFSKKLDNHCHALALYFAWYNWMKLHKAHRNTPAMAAGLTDRLYDWSDILKLVDAGERQLVIQKRRELLSQSN